MVPAEGPHRLRLRDSAPSQWAAIPVAPYAYRQPCAAWQDSSRLTDFSAGTASRLWLGRWTTLDPWFGRWKDCALVLNATAGYDSNDPASANRTSDDYTSAFTGDVRGLRIGVAEGVLRGTHRPAGGGQRCAGPSTCWVRWEAVVSEVSWPMYHHSQAISGVVSHV